MQVPGNAAKLVSTLPSGAGVPEQPVEVQAEALQELLVGHRIFARMRGKLTYVSTDSIMGYGFDGSPSATLTKFDDTVSDLRVMCNYLALLRWHGCRRAAEELHYALTHENFVMWCEKVPFDKTTPCTILMFEPKLMLRLARWWSQEPNLEAQLWGQYGTGNACERAELSDETKYFVDMFRELGRRPSRHGTAYTLFTAIWLQIELAFIGLRWDAPKYFADEARTPRGPTFPLRAGLTNGADMGGICLPLDRKGTR